ncbi:MAG: HAMP domain-containing histidine kinase [Treponema sp.]|nr:HAMP domain-containing histidine kinase [Treponema sp.]
MEVRQSTVEIINAYNERSENIREIIREVQDINDISIDIVDLHGRSLLTPTQTRFRDENADHIALAIERGGESHEYIDIPQGRGGFVIVRRDSRGGNLFILQSLVYAKTAYTNTGEQFAVIIRAIISPVDATVTTLRYQLYYISGIVLLLSVILAIIIAKHIANPIEKITQSALVLASGSYNTHFTGKGYHEISVLSDTLNTAASELGRVENLRRELFANVSHDLRTPLALIYSYAEMMHDFPSEITSEQTQTILDETKRLTMLVNDVLDMSKLENDMETMNYSEYNLTQSIQQIIESMGKLLQKEGFEIVFLYEEDIYVKADKIKMDRVFYNLLINAVNYSGESRKITIEQTVNKDQVTVSVTDYGEGIEEKDLPFIWDRYYKSGKTHTRALIGSGLGLYIVKKIIDNHSGKYGVESKPGEGSTFRFEIPVKRRVECLN